jgi:hypothetical protein
MVANIAVLLAFLCIRERAIAAVDLAKCSRLNLTPTRGLCSGYSFTMNQCTGGSNAFEYDDLGWTSLVSAKIGKLEQITDSICYDRYDEVCMRYIATKVGF